MNRLLTAFLLAALAAATFSCTASEEPAGSGTEAAAEGAAEGGAAADAGAAADSGTAAATAAEAGAADADAGAADAGAADAEPGSELTDVTEGAADGTGLFTPDGAERPTVTWAGPEEAVSYEERIKRNYIYIAGYREMPQYIIEAALQAEAKRREAAGSYVGYELTEEAIQKGVQESIDKVLAIDANADFWEAIAGMGFTRESYHREVANKLRLKQMYLPADPSNWPAADLERLLTGPYGSTWEVLLKGDHEKMLAAQAAGEPIPQLNEQTLDTYILPSIVQGVMNSVTVRYPSDGLPEGVALRVDDHEVKTDELLAKVQPLLTPELMREAETFTDTLMLAEEALKESGNWLDEAAIAKEWEAELALYEGSFITHDAMVLSFFKFPTMESYRQYFRVRRSFRTTLPDPLPQEMLTEHVAKRGLFLGGGKVQATILLISAKDPRSGRFAMVDDPFGDAKQRADEVAEILKGGEDYIAVLEEYSDIPAEIPNASPGMPQPDKGRFPLMMRNDLRGYLGESEFTDVIYGGSISDEIFFDAEKGAVYGPVKLPVGWAFYRVEQKVEGPGVDPQANPQQDFLVRDDILGTRLLEFLRGLRE